MKVYSYLPSLMVGFESLLEFDAQFYDPEKKVVYVSTMGDKLEGYDIEPNDSVGLFLDVAWVGINSKKFYKKGEQKWMSKVDLHKYFQQLEPPPDIVVGVDVPTLDQIQVLKEVKDSTHNE